MKNDTIKRIPLLFLFTPTVLTALILFFFFQTKLQATYERQLEANAKHIVNSIVQVARQPLSLRQYGELKQRLWTFAQQTDSSIINIVVYNKTGDFVTALNLTEQVIDSSLDDFPTAPFFRQNDEYLAFGRIGWDENAVLADSDELVVGYVQVSFATESAQADNSRDIFIVSSIVLFCVLLGWGLWRYRYSNYYRQMAQALDALRNLNKGYKHVELPTDGSNQELNELGQQLNGLIVFFEKRLTMKQFESTALEQALGETSDRLAAAVVEIDEFKDSQQNAQNNASSLLTGLYQVMYQNLQAQLAVIEDTLTHFIEPVASGTSEQNQVAVTEAINQLNQMLSEIKVLADISTNSVKEHIEYIRLGQLITSVYQLITPLAHARDLEFIVRQPDHPIDVEIDVNQIQKVLMVLMQNAVSKTTSGFIKLSVEVTTSENTDVQRVCFKVQDSGIGLSDNQYNLLSRDEVSSGLSEDNWLSQGLSLMVAKKTTEQLGGCFSVKSLSGLGAEISIALNCRVSHAQGPDVSGFEGRSILVYDPVVQSADVIGEVLADNGALTILCGDSEQICEVQSKSKSDYAIFCRPQARQQQQLFDQTLSTIIESMCIEKCLIFNADLTLRQVLPKGWKQTEKPFILDTVCDHFSDCDSKTVNGQDSIGTNTVVPQAERLLKSSKTIKILAVDDNETNLKLLSVILRSYPVTLVLASSGSEAVLLSQKQAFDVILMDKEMPEMNGVQTSLNIRQLALHQQTPIVVFSANVTEAEREELISQGINDCIEKPLDEEKFYYLMDNWCTPRWAILKAK
jgi:CheY-like chemotaxis protein/signal transduction histidine kinase